MPVGTSVCRAVLLLGTLAAYAVAQGPSLSVRPNSPAVSGAFTVDIAVDGAKDLYAFQFDLTFPAGSVTPGAITEGSFLATAGTTYFVTGTPDSGVLRITASTLVGAIPGANGSGVLARIAFMANAPGTVPIGIANPILLASNLLTIAGTATAGASVTVNVSVEPSVFVSPQRLSFEYQTGQPIPAAQNIAVESTRFLSLTATTSAAWLAITPSAVQAPATFRVAINPSGLAPGNYYAEVRIATSGSDQATVPVNLTVYAPSQLITLADSLSFRYTNGGAPPDPQTLYVTASSRAVSVSVSTSTNSGGNWLSATPAVATTPVNVTVAVSTAGLAPGKYTGVISLSQIGAVNSFKMIPVTLTVNAQAPVVTLTAIVNAASFASGPIAPGEMVTLFGSGLGPRDLIQASRAIDTVLGQTRVLFDGLPAPILYAQNGQIAAIVPYAMAGRAATQVQVEYQGTRSAALSVPVQAAAPGIFTVDGSGRGQAAALNENGTLNGVSNAAAGGSVLVLFATGEGATNPPGVDGQLGTALSPKPLLPVTVTIGGVEAEVLYAGAAPGLAGALQVNVRIPDNLTPGNTTPVVLAIGGVASQPGVTATVR